MIETILPLLPLFFVAAALYASVGHGGASAYLAIFALAGVASPAIAPVALILNILAASIAFWQYRRAGHFLPRLLMPFVVGSIPASFLGGTIRLSASMYSLLLGLALVLAALRILWNVRQKGADGEPRPLKPMYGLLLGAVLGLISGALGIGGGVFLSPILLLFRWADVKKTAAVSSAFILLNSLSGLGGHFLRGNIPDSLPVLLMLVTVGIGAWIGSQYSTRRLEARYIRIALGAVLLLASVKLLITGMNTLL